MRIIAASIILVTVTCATVGASAAPGTGDPAGEFARRVSAYVALHERLEGPLPAAEALGTPHELLIRQSYLAAAIRGARSQARQGDIFAPRIAEWLRATIVEALPVSDIPSLAAEMADEDQDATTRDLRINQPYPVNASQAVPCRLLLVLPALPPHVEYRVVGHSLVLLDVHANLVVDWLPHAFQ